MVFRKNSISISEVHKYWATACDVRRLPTFIFPLLRFMDKKHWWGSVFFKFFLSDDDDDDDLTNEWIDIFLHFYFVALCQPE